MNPLSHTILDSYQTRKRKKQKTAFIEAITSALENAGYSVSIEEGRQLFHTRNILLGDVEKADVIITAHYDTCALMPIPNFIAPKRIFFYLIYQLLLALLMIVFISVPMFLILRIDAISFLAPLMPLIMCALLLYFMMFAVDSKTTANDNTSGVITVLETALSLPNEYRHRVAFVLFDHEETGLLGSAAFKARHNEAMKDKPLINFDCVSEGDDILVLSSKIAFKDASLQKKLQNAFVPIDGKVVDVASMKGAFYPSDQAHFKKGIAVAAFRKNRLFGLYLARIHTTRDTVFDQRNIDYLCASMLRFITAD